MSIFNRAAASGGLTPSVGGTTYSQFAGSIIGPEEVKETLDKEANTPVLLLSEKTSSVNRPEAYDAEAAEEPIVTEHRSGRTDSETDNILRNKLAPLQSSKRSSHQVVEKKGTGLFP